MNLSPVQKAIVEHVDGALLVKAGPGSGKTRVLTERVKRLLSVKKRTNVLALTFSNMAAEEMRSRLESDPEVGETIKRVTIGTIHSFCLDMIQSRGYLIGLRPDVSLFENENDRTAILRTVISDEAGFNQTLRRQPNPENYLSQCLSAISEQKRSLISPKYCTKEEPFPTIYQKYNNMLWRQNAIDFDDILFFTYLLLVDNPDIASLYNSYYKYICIDESQDLNYAQYRVIRAICRNKSHNIMMVGDENQSIYAFNGSSSKYMSKFFEKDFRPTIYNLDINFRSAKEIIEFSNTLTGNFEDLEKYYYNGKLSITEYEDEVTEAKAICETIQDLMLNGHKDIENALSFHNFAVIARNKYVFSQLEHILNEEKIPFYFKKIRSGIACETDFMEAFDLILRLLMNPLDIYHRIILSNLVSKNKPIDLESSNIKIIIRQLLNDSKFTWLKDVLLHITADGNLDFDKVIEILNTNLPDNLQDDENYLLQKDIEEWRNHWLIFKNQTIREHRTLISFRNAISLGKTQKKETETGIALLTAHMSKGLEFEVVFVIGLSEGTFPDYRAVRSGGEALEQEKNNMYVAVTRAKRLCYLSYPGLKMMPWGDYKQQNPSRYIKDYISSRHNIRKTYIL